MILVAGGTGFIGSAIVRELHRQGKDVAVMSHGADRIATTFRDLHVVARRGDAHDAQSLQRAVEGIDTVVSSMQFPNFPIEDRRRGETFEEVDARGNERLAAAAKAAGVRCYIYLSGSGVSPEGRYHWLRAKWQAEEAIRNSGLRYTILRPSWVYGPEDNALNRFARFARTLPFVPVIGDGSQRLQPVFVDDIARVVAGSLDTEAAANQALEIGGPDVVTMDEVLHTMLAVMGKRKPLIHAPAAFPRAVGALMELLPLPKRPLSRDAVTFVTMDAVADNTALHKVFPDMRLTSLREGLSTYLSRGRAEPA